MCIFDLLFLTVTGSCSRLGVHEKVLDTGLSQSFKLLFGSFAKFMPKTGAMRKICFEPGSGEIATNDNYKKRLLVSMVKGNEYMEEIEKYGYP